MGSLGLARALAFFLLLGQGGCFPFGALDDPDRDIDPSPPCDSNPQALSPGEHVEGKDPEALFAPCLGTHGGTLTWTMGGETLFQLELSRGIEPAHIASGCVRPSAVYTYPEFRCSTADSGLDQRGSAILSVYIDGVPPDGRQPAPPLSLPVVPKWQWTSALVSHLPVDASDYSDASLTLELDYPAGGTSPSSGFVVFHGEPLSQPGTPDVLVIASIAFP